MAFSFPATFGWHTTATALSTAAASAIGLVTFWGFNVSDVDLTYYQRRTDRSSTHQHCVVGRPHHAYDIGLTMGSR